jgi:hypothetical protein
MLESSVQQTSEKGLEVVRLIRMDVLPVVRPAKEVAAGTLRRGDGVGKEEVVKPLRTERHPPSPDEYVLGLWVWTASATTSPTELRPIEGPLKVDKVLVDLSPAESVVGDGVRVTADPAGRGNGRGNGLTAGRHSDDWLRRVVVVMVKVVE